MALSFLNGRHRDSVISIDLGRSVIKAVQLQRNGKRNALLRYALLEVPRSERELSPGLVAKHVKEVQEALETKETAVSLALGVNESMVRFAELPQMPVKDMREVLRNNSKHYLQQDFPDHVFDCFAFPRRNSLSPDETHKAGSAQPKQKVLVVGAKNQMMEDFRAAIRSTGLRVEQMVPGVIGLVNAFALAMPEVFSREVVALVDIGFKSTSISIVSNGELIISRTCGFGGDRLTSGLAETLGIAHDQAEDMKMTMLAEERASFDASSAPWARELRVAVDSLVRELVASIDFFEHDADRPVGQVFISGGSSRSELLVQTLQAKLSAKCRTWSPLNALDLELPPQQAAALEPIGQQLAVAVGSGAAAL